MAKKRKTTANSDATEEISFEQSLEKLEEIVRQLEDGGLGLSESLARYEEGVKHLKKCDEALRTAERRIELLSSVDAEGNPVTEPFDDDSMKLEEKQQSRSRRRSRRSDSADKDDVDEQGGLF